MKFRTKIAVCMVIFLTLAFGIGGNLLISISFHDNLNSQKQRASDSYEMVLNILSVANNVGEKNFYKNTLDVLEQMDKKESGSWGELRLSTEGNTIYKSSGFQASVKEETWKSGEDYQLVTFQEKDRHFLQIRGRMKEESNSFYLEGLYDISSIYQLRANLQSVYQRIFLIMVIVGFGLSWWLAGILSNPVVEEMKAAMERQESFMGSLAHELKTPMTAIIGYADLLRSRELSEKQRRESANYIFHEGKRIETLSWKLLDLLLMKGEGVELVRYQPKRVLKDIQNTLEEILITKNLILHTEWDEGECFLEPSLVMALLINLVENAAKASEEGSSIYVNITLTSEGCVIYVKDEGCGIPKEEREKITEAFYRVDKSRSRAQGGVGLGLSLCKEIVALHGGSLSFEENHPQGTIARACLKGGR